MNKLEQLIKKLCPDGVEYKRIGDVVDYEQPSKYLVKSTDYNDEYATPVLTAGQTFILGYTNETDGIFQASVNNPVIIFDDFTGTFKWVNFPFKAKSSAMKMLKTKVNSVYLRYIFHVMGNIGYSSNEHKRLWIGVYSNISIPIPPLEVQAEIVRILDKFTELTTELTKELTTELANRKKQYEYYQKHILTFDKNTTWKTLGDIGKISMCKRIMKHQTAPQGDVPFYKIGTFGKKADAYISHQLFEDYKQLYSYPKKGDILISAAGTIGRTVVFNGEPSYFQDSNIVWIDNDESQVTNSFLYYWYQTFPWKISSGGTIQRLYNDNIAKTKVPVLPTSEQRRIVDILDRFDKLCNDISDGLPAEIEARQKQYEYYRDKLLTFKEVGTSET